MHEELLVPFLKGMIVNVITDTVVGIRLPELCPLAETYSLETLMREYMDSDRSSRGATDFLHAASPSRSRTDRSQKQLVLLEGKFLPKDPFSESVKRFARGRGWSVPSFEDALRIYPLITHGYFNDSMRSLVFLHEPVKREVIGISMERGRVVLTAHKAEPKEGWFCRNTGFVFRLP